MLISLIITSIFSVCEMAYDLFFYVYHCSAVFRKLWEILFFSVLVLQMPFEYWSGLSAVILEFLWIIDVITVGDVRMEIVFRFVNIIIWRAACVTKVVITHLISYVECHHFIFNFRICFFSWTISLIFQHFEELHVLWYLKIEWLFTDA